MEQVSVKATEEPLGSEKLFETVWVHYITAKVIFFPFIFVAAFAVVWTQRLETMKQVGSDVVFTPI